MALQQSCKRIVPIILLLVLTGCGRMFNAMYGLHFYKKEVPQVQIDRMRDRLGLPETNDYYLAETYYDTVKAIVDPNERLQQALLQPLQLRYFNKDGELVSMVANCHVGGFPNLKWDRFHIADSLPIRRTAFLDSLWTLGSDAAFLRPYDGTSPLDQQVGEYHVNVYWSYRMGRQFKRLKRTVDEMQERHGNKVTVWYVNIDALYKRIEDKASASADL